jgi:hypothetical protein
MVNTFDQYFEKHNGKTVKVDGIAYRIKYSEYNAIYPRKHVAVSIDLVPVNKNSEYYRKIKRKLGDDWVKDAQTLSDKSLMQIVQQLGGLD